MIGVFVYNNLYLTKLKCKLYPQFVNPEAFVVTLRAHDFFQSRDNFAEFTLLITVKSVGNNKAGIMFYRVFSYSTFYHMLYFSKKAI